ncbi:MAG: MarR family transcriptional regulator [Acidimicrobiales bacterium]
MTALDTPGTATGVNAARLRFVLMRLARALRRESRSKLTASQISALATIEEFGPMRISTLATHESMDPSVATRCVAGLEELGLFERKDDPEDKRARLVDLSDLGRRALIDLWNERTLELNTRLAQLSHAERLTIEAALPALEKITRED